MSGVAARGWLTGEQGLTMFAPPRPGGGRGKRRRGQSMSESGPPDPLQRLGEQIDQARLQAGEGRPRRSDVTAGGALGFGLRVSIEMVSALIVGVGLGWVANHFIAAIRPWGIIAGFLLGSAAGFANVFRAVQGMGRPPPRAGGE
ncbi:MAG TPA: AtpZ/AtpI family protein [Stellaceae bacterium]|nr:AtpZ/AtpI family protein [Stellaceae bacterium]